MSSPYDAQLVQVSGQPQVYLVVNGQACWVPNPNTFVQLFGDNFNLVQEITGSEFNTLPVGATLANGAYIATVSGTATNYLVSGQAHPFASTAVYDTYPFDATNVQTVSQVVLTELGNGWTITS